MSIEPKPKSIESRGCYLLLVIAGFVSMGVALVGLAVLVTMLRVHYRI